MTRISSITVVGMVALGFLLGPAAPQGLLAQEAEDEHAAHHAAEDTEEAAEEAPPGKQMPMKMSKAMRMRCRVMMTMRVRPYDPAVVLALRQQLELTDEQVEQIEEILAEARKRTRGLLTEAQQKELQPLAGMPETAMEMHRQMMEKMKGRMGKDRMPCPMMEMMERMEQQQDGGEEMEEEPAME